jgi:hypothetical protein
VSPDELAALEARIEERRARRRALAAMDRRALEDRVIALEDELAIAKATVVAISLEAVAAHQRRGRKPTVDRDQVCARIAELGPVTKETKAQVAGEFEISVRRVEQLLETEIYRLGVIDPAVVQAFRPKK